MFTFVKVIQRICEYGRGLGFRLIVRLLGGKCGRKVKIARGVYWKYPPHNGVTIGDNVDIGPGTYFDVPRGARLSIGNDVKLTCGTVISAAASVTIGHSALIAEYVSIRDSEHNSVPHEEIKNQGLKQGEIIIGEDVWIGRNAAIFMNSIINRGAIIGAGSLCKNQTYESFGIYVGTPAKKIKERN